MGISKTITFDYEAYSEDLFSKALVDKIAEVIDQHKPDIVITHWPISDYPDFIAAGSAVLRALLTRKLKKYPMLCFSETLTGKHTKCFHPSLYIDISKSIEKKKEACAVLWQGKQLDYFFYPFALPVAEFRGRECGVEFAEAYVIYYGSGYGLMPNWFPEEAKRAPVSLKNATKLLEMREFVQGIYPTYPTRRRK